MRGSRKFCQSGGGGGGPTLTFLLLLLFLIAEGREDPNTTISEPSLACQQNAI